MNKLELSEIINSISVKPNGAMSLLLGSGASISSGIPSGGQMVWDFKRAIYCAENRIPKTAFGDMSSEIAQTTIQDYFNGKEGFPACHSPEEYSYYFEKFLGNSIDREAYIKRK